MKTADLIIRIDEIIAQADKAIASAKTIGRYTTLYVDYSLLMGFKTASLSFLQNIFEKGHPYYYSFSSSVNSREIDHVKVGKEILQNVRHEIANGWIFSIQSLVSAEIFSDFLEMSNH